MAGNTTEDSYDEGIRTYFGDSVVGTIPSSITFPLDPHEVIVTRYNRAAMEKYRDKKKLCAECTNCKYVVLFAWPAYEIPNLTKDQLKTFFDVPCSDNEKYRNPVTGNLVKNVRTIVQSAQRELKKYPAKPWYDVIHKASYWENSHREDLQLEDSHLAASYREDPSRQNLHREDLQLEGLYRTTSHPVDSPLHDLHREDLHLENSHCEDAHREHSYGDVLYRGYSSPEDSHQENLHSEDSHREHTRREDSYLESIGLTDSYGDGYPVVPPLPYPALSY